MQKTDTLIRLGFVYFFLAAIVAHLLRPDLNPSRRYLSEYAIGANGWVMVSAFIALGLASLALMVRLWRSLPAHPLTRLGLAFLGVWSAGILLTGVLPTDLTVTPVTTTGLYHNITGRAAFFASIPGMLLISWAFRSLPGWKRLFPLAMAVALLAASALLAWLTLIQLEAVGIEQRVLIASITLWLLAVIQELIRQGSKKA